MHLPCASPHGSILMLLLRKLMTHSWQLLLLLLLELLLLLLMLQLLLLLVGQVGDLNRFSISGEASLLGCSVGCKREGGEGCGQA